MYSLTQSKCCWWHGCTQAFTNKRFPPAIFRLYEFLKNSQSDDLKDCKTGILLNNKTWLNQSFGFAVKHLWWRMTGIEPTTPVCKAGALPTSLIPNPPGIGCTWWWWVWLVWTNDPRLIKTVLKPTELQTPQTGPPTVDQSKTSRSLSGLGNSFCGFNNFQSGLFWDIEGVLSVFF